MDIDSEDSTHNSYQHQEDLPAENTQIFQFDEEDAINQDLKQKKPVKAAVRQHKIKNSIYKTILIFLKNLYQKLQRYSTKSIVLSINSPYKTKWDLFVMILATYNCFGIPFEVSFDAQTLQSKSFFILNSVIDFIFFVDLVVSFRTSYIDQRTGFEIFALKSLAKNYIKGQFFIDLLATIPFDSLAELIWTKITYIKFLGALKLVRVMRLSKIISYLRTTEEVKATLKLFKLVFFLILYIHCFGCMWWYFVKSSKSWIPTTCYGDSENFYAVYESDLLYQYLNSLYAAMILMTGNCVGPRTTGQVLLASFGLFMGSIINANIFGELAVLISYLSAKTNDFQQKITQVNTTIANLQLPQELTERIRDFVIANQEGLESQQEMKRFMSVICPSLRAQVINHDFYDLVQSQPTFGYDQRIVDIILEKIAVSFEKPGDKITKQGEFNEKIFFLSRGFVESFKQLDKTDLFYLETFNAGQMFGEVSAVLGCRSDVTNICKNYCKIGFLTTQDYEWIVFKLPSLQIKMMKQIKTHLVNPVNSFFLDHYERMYIFKNMSKQAAREVSFHCYLNKIQVFQDLILPGEPCKAIYLVMSGVIQVYLKLKNGSELVIDYLGVGSFIGQYSMIESEILVCGFRAVSSEGCLLIVLQQESLQAISKNNSEVRSIQAEALNEVTKNGVNPIDYIRFNDLSLNQDIKNRKKINLNRFQRAMSRLSKMSKTLRLQGITDFQIGGMLFDLIGNSFGNEDEELSPEDLWHQTIVSRVDLKALITETTLEVVRDKLDSIKDNFMLHKSVFDQIKNQIDFINFHEACKNEQVKKQLLDIMTFNDKEKEIIDSDNMLVLGEKFRFKI